MRAPCVRGALFRGASVWTSKPDIGVCSGMTATPLADAAERELTLPEKAGAM